MGKRLETAFTDVINATGGSVSLPEYGILRSGKTASIRTELLNTRDYRDFINRGIIVIGGDKELAKKKERDEKKAKANLLDRDDKPRKKGKSIKRVGAENDSEDDFVNGVEPGERDGIVFVDIEQNEERIRSHPLLGKLQKND